MNRQQLHLYSFLTHLVKENFAGAQKALGQVIEHKIRASAGKAKMRLYAEKKMTSKTKPTKMKDKKVMDKKMEKVK